MLTKQKTFLIISFVILFLGFNSNFWGSALEQLFDPFDEYSECLAIGRIARSDKEGIFSDGALPGVNYDAATVPPNSDIWGLLYLEQRPQYLTNDVPDSYDTYMSQTGGQFVMYGVLQKVLPFENSTKLKIYHCLNAILSALCFTLFLGWVFRNFGMIPGLVVLFLIAMSNWLTLFGHSLWWGLWASYIPFITMLLVLEYNHRTRKLSLVKILLYLFLSVFAKCVFNGYEFISTVLVSAMCPIIFYGILDKKELKPFIFFFFKASCVAIFAVLAQMLILITQIRAVIGSFGAGIEYIISSYVRRSISADDHFAHLPFTFIFKKYLLGNAFQWNFLSQNSSAFYFGYLIIIVILLAGVIYYFGRKFNGEHSRLNLALLYTTTISLIAPVSWFIIFKQHSANHFHLDYIVWYMPTLLFGFVIIGEGISLILEKVGVYKNNRIRR